MEKRHLFVCSIKICLSTLIFLPIGFASPPENMRGLRYCEIVLAKSGFNFSIYSTANLNDCPNDEWSQLTTDLIKKETGAYYVYLNGPFYWVSDGIEYSAVSTPKKLILNGIEMQNAGALHLGIMDVVKGDDPYQEHTVQQQATLVYKAGHPIYELVDPNQHVYVMQSYSIKVHPQTQASLSTLGSQLKLPYGWFFRKGILRSDVHLTAVNDQVVMVQDNFLNTYQRVAHDFLTEG
jgi:hypothetical protein